MAQKYYCLVSGLIDYTLDADRKGFDALAQREMIDEALSAEHLTYRRLLYTFYDVENLINGWNGKESFNVLGNLTREQITEGLKDTDQLPLFLAEVIDAFRAAQGEGFDAEECTVDTTVPIEKALWEAYYEECAASKCSFIREWYSFDADLRNITSAFIARLHGLNVTEQLVGQSEITEQLSRSTAADFSLKNEVDYIESLVSLLELPDIIAKEHQIDLIRWNKAEEITVFDYFDINNLLAYLVKINLIHRWVALDKTKGAQMLQRLVAELTNKERMEAAEQEELLKN